MTFKLHLPTTHRDRIVLTEISERQLHLEIQLRNTAVLDPDEAFTLAQELLRWSASKTPTTPPIERPRPCTNNSPPWFTGRWRDWHRGHGCDRDDGKPRTADGQREIDDHAAGKPPWPGGEP